MTSALPVSYLTNDGHVGEDIIRKIGEVTHDFVSESFRYQKHELIDPRFEHLPRGVHTAYKNLVPTHGNRRLPEPPV